LKTHTLSFSLALLIALFQGCSGHTLQNLIDGDSENKQTKTEENTPVNPSQNSALNTISPTQRNNDGNGLLQKKADNFIENDWTPTVEKNSSIKATNEDKERPFTIQEYVDKAGVYLDAQPDSNKTSHKEKMDQLPGIGVKRGR